MISRAARCDAVGWDRASSTSSSGSEPGPLSLASEQGPDRWASSPARGARVARQSARGQHGVVWSAPRDGRPPLRPTRRLDDKRAAHQPGGGAPRVGGAHGAVASEQSARGGAHLKAAAPSSSSESVGSSARARCHPSPPPSSRRRLGTEPPSAKAPGASGSWKNRPRFMSAPGTGTRGASARGQHGVWPAPCGDDRRLVGQRPCCCRERRAGERRGACGRGRGAATVHWSRAPGLEGVWKCAGPCLQSGAL